MNHVTQNEKEVFGIEQGRRRIYCNPASSPQLGGIHEPIASSEGITHGSCDAVSWGRQRPNDTDAQAPCTTRMEVSRRDCACNEGAYRRRVHLSNGAGHATEPGGMVCRDMASTGQAGRVRSGSGGRIRTVSLPRKNATLSPSRGLVSALIGPSRGLESLPPSPSGGPMRAIFGTSPSPSGGHPLDIAICGGCHAS